MSYTLVLRGGRFDGLERFVDRPIRPYKSVFMPPPGKVGAMIHSDHPASAGPDGYALTDEVDADGRHVYSHIEAACPSTSANTRSA